MAGVVILTLLTPYLYGERRKVFEGRYSQPSQFFVKRILALSVIIAILEGIEIYLVLTGFLPISVVAILAATQGVGATIYILKAGQHSD
ncbi:MAG: hypothetical protein QW429_05150 [Thermoprotei archaeon]